MKNIIYVLVVVSILAMPAYGWSGINDGLVAHYAFEGDVSDSSGNGNHGIESNGVSYVNGVFGQAVSFDGSSEIVVANNVTLNPSDAMTSMLWFKPHSPVGRWSINYLLSKNFQQAQIILGTLLDLIEIRHSVLVQSIFFQIHSIFKMQVMVLLSV